MKYPHLFARCLEPVAITREWLEVCIAVVTDDAYFSEERARALSEAGGMPLENDRAMTVENGVATIHVEGPLVRKAGMVANVSGLTSYDALRAEFRTARADRSVREIEWMFHSNGGEVSGLFELADEVYAARSGKPMRAIVATANSAAYVIAAAVGNIEIEQTGRAGSIGVIAGVEKKDPNGKPIIEFTSSVSPKKNLDPASDDGRADYQAEVDYLGEQLVEKVAAYRGVTPDYVKEHFGKGGTMRGAQAVAAGLADRIVASASPLRTGANMNPSIITALGLPADATDDQALAKIQALAKERTEAAAFQARILTLAGETSLDGAVGVIASAFGDAKEVKDLRARVAASEQQSRNDAFRASLTTTRLSVADLTDGIPSMLDEGNQKAADAAVKALSDADAANGQLVAAAIAGAVSLSDAEAKRVNAYFGRKGKVAPPPAVTPPARDHTAESTGIDKDAAARIDAACGHKPEDVDAFIAKQSAAR